MDVSIIIVSYNAEDVLKRCLDAVFQHTQNLEFEVIVVDNASTDGAIGVLKDYEEKYKDLHVIYSRENLGFAKGNNLGAKQAKGKYLLLLNNDAILTENAPKLMINWLEARHNFGAASCQILDDEQKISPILSAGFFPNLPAIFAWAFFLDDLPLIKNLFKHYHIHAGVNLDKLDFDWVTGAFMVVRKTVWDKVGGMDENLFMYGEDLYLCYRIKLLGLKIGYNPATKVIHIGQASQNKMPRGYILGEFTGLKYFYAKNYSQIYQMLLGFILDVAAFNRIIFWLVRLKPEIAKIYLKTLFV